MSRRLYDMSEPVYRSACKTDRQVEVLDTYLGAGQSARETAVKLGIAQRNVNKTLKLIRKQADAIATSTLVKVEDGQGNVALQWIKKKGDESSHLDAIAEGLKEALPQAEAQEFTHRTVFYDDDIIPFFNIGDAHLGMLAHTEETGKNFDLKIAERELLVAMEKLIASAPYSERCVIQDMGDFTHYENMAGVTSASGHALDFDTRFPKMIKVYTRLFRSIIAMALAKYKFVDIIINQGNHSRINDIWMAQFLSHVYEKEDRINVLDNTSVFIPYRMGNTFVMCHHSDKCKPNKLVDVMATDFREHFGACKYKYIDIGHIHHKSMAKEYGDVIIESFNQLAPMDLYAHDGGWRSRSFLTCVVRSKKYGEKGRMVVTAEEVYDLLGIVDTRKKVYEV